MFLWFKRDVTLVKYLWTLSYACICDIVLIMHAWKIILDVEEQSILAPQDIISFKCIYGFGRLWPRITPFLHSEKFNMNEEVDSFLSEKVSNLLLTWKVNSITVLNECPPLIVSQEGKLSAATLKWNLHPQQEHHFWECIIIQSISHMWQDNVTNAFYNSYHVPTACNPPPACCPCR